MFRVFKNHRDRVEWSSGRVVTMERIEREEEDGMVYPKTTGTLGGVRVEPNDADR